MNNFFRTAILAAVAVFSATAVQAADTEIHNFANYNVRYVNPNNGDTGDKLWDNRGTYVVQLIKDYDFDIVGMEEVTGRNNGKSLNQKTGRSQLEDLKAWLADYSILAWERSGNNNAKDYSYNAIAYKKNRYECLESGCFWLSPKPDIAGPGWDPDPQYSGIWRTCGWAKMRVRATGEEFIFAVTHVNYGPSLDGKMSGELISKRLTQMAGELPVVLVGDFNLRRGDHVEAYRGYAAYLSDAALTAEQVSCLPASNPQTTLTTQGWTPVTSSANGSEFDYCFYKNMKVKSRHIITENYGRSVNPSDHFALLMRCVLAKGTHQQTACVDASAAAGGDGSAAHPFRTIAEGIAAAGHCGTVLVAEGDYAESVKLPCSVALKGGYNKDFTAVTGRSAIDASSFSTPAIEVEQWYSLAVSGFDIRNYKSTLRSTDGAVRFGGYKLSLSDMAIEGCSAYEAGGAVYADGGDISIRNCSVSNCSAEQNGGASRLKSSDNIRIEGSSFRANKARSGSAVAITNFANLVVYNSSLTENEGMNSGALYIYDCPSAEKAAVVNTTLANNVLASSGGLPAVVRKFGGAGLCTDLSVDIDFNMAHITAVGNVARFAGSNKSNYNAAAINAAGLGRHTLINSIVAGNYSDAAHADVFVNESALMNKDRYNIYSCAEGVSYGADATDFLAADAASALTAVKDFLGGEADASTGCYRAPLVLKGTWAVQPVSTSYAGKPVNVISNYLRMLESQFGLDIDGNGSVSGSLVTDQWGQQRADMTLPGASEFADKSGVEAIEAPTAAAVCIAPGVYSLMAAGACVYSIDGRLVASLAADADGSVTVDLADAPKGIYIVRPCDAPSFKILR